MGIRRQDPALAKTREERQRIEQYRKAVAEAQAGKLSESFRRLENLGAGAHRLIRSATQNPQAKTYVERIEAKNRVSMADRRKFIGSMRVRAALKSKIAGRRNDRYNVGAG
jgi:hypothetical protein